MGPKALAWVACALSQPWLNALSDAYAERKFLSMDTYVGKHPSKMFEIVRKHSFYLIKRNVKSCE